MITRYLCKSCERPFRHVGHLKACPYCGAANFVTFPYTEGTGRGPAPQNPDQGENHVAAMRWAQDAALYEQDA